MKIRKFNENFERKDVSNIINDIDNYEFTPPKDSVPLKSIYKSIIIRTNDYIDSITLFANADINGNKSYKTNWITIDLFEMTGNWLFSFYPDENSVYTYIRRKYRLDFRDHTIIGYNDINHAEMESILSGYDIYVDEMWGIPR